MRVKTLKAGADRLDGLLAYYAGLAEDGHLFPDEADRTRAASDAELELTTGGVARRGRHEPALPSRV